MASTCDLTGKIFKTKRISTVDSNYLPVVWKGIYTSTEGQADVIAMKVMKPIMFLDSQTAERTLQRLLREAEVLRACIHPNLVPFHGISYKVDSRKKKRIPCLISPFYTNGSVMKYLACNPRAVRTDLVRQFFAGLAYLHERSIVHGSIIPTNILIDDKGNAMLADYGISPFPRSKSRDIMTMSFPPIRYMAPELLLLKEDKTPTFTKKSDVWAASMTGLEILSGKIPYVQRRGDAQFIEACLAGEIPNRAYYPSVKLGPWHAFSRCWKISPRKRPTIQRLRDFLDFLYASDLELAAD